MSGNLMRLFLILFAFAFTGIAFPASAAENDDAQISYTVKRGDTLIQFAQEYLVSLASYRIVQRENGIRNPRQLPVGSTLYIRRSLLKYDPATARILSVRGNVTIASASRNAAAKAGQTVAEGARLTTSGSSFVTLSLANGSRISLPSNSDVRIRLLRTYRLGGSLDYDFDILRGGTRSKVAPQKSKDDRYRVRTPKAVSAVRGTDFQSRYDPDADRDFAEVIEGDLEVAAGSDANLALPAGQGLAVAKGGTVIKESLLAEPTLIDPGKMQVNPTLRFATKPGANESGYRFTLSTDAGFVDQIADVMTETSAADIEGLENGNYFVRARAISANGIQGNPATFAFKRRLNGVKASAGGDEAGYGFKWFSDGDGRKSFHFQLFRNEPNGLPIVDEPGLQKEQVSISDLPVGDYFWRVGSVQFLDGEVTTNWTEFEKLSVAP